MGMLDLHPHPAVMRHLSTPHCSGVAEAEWTVRTFPAVMGPPQWCQQRLSEESALLLLPGSNEAATLLLLSELCQRKLIKTRGLNMTQGLIT